MTKCIKRIRDLYLHFTYLLTYTCNRTSDSLLPLAHLGAMTNYLGFGIKQLKIKVTDWQAYRVQR